MSEATTKQIFLAPVRSGLLEYRISMHELFQSQQLHSNIDNMKLLYVLKTHKTGLKFSAANYTHVTAIYAGLQAA